MLSPAFLADWRTTSSGPEYDTTTATSPAITADRDTAERRLEGPAARERAGGVLDVNAMDRRR